MTYARDRFDTVPPMPPWVTSGPSDSPEDVTFLSGAALAHLHLVLQGQGLPHRLLRDRLALRAAEACVAMSGRPERAAEMRDAVAFLQPGDQAGPAGDVYLSWRRAAARPLGVAALHMAFPALEAAQVAVWMDAGQGTPVARAAGVLQAVLVDRPRDWGAALVLADAALAQALGWRHLVPLLGPEIHRRDLHKTGADLQLACHKAVVSAAAKATRDAAELARRAARLREVAPKLRAKGAEAAIDLFLSRAAVAPTALSSLASDRAARRFCDRLVALGAVRELTGRDTFRLYGV